MFAKEEERNDCLYREEIDFDLYSKSIELQNLKRECEYDIAEMIDYDKNSLINNINRITILEKEIEECLLES